MVLVLRGGCSNEGYVTQIAPVSTREAELNTFRWLALCCDTSTEL